MTIDKKNNDKIDQLLQKRQDGIYAYARSTKDLLDMGIKVMLASSGEMAVPTSYNDHLDKFNRSNLEFEWLAKHEGIADVAQFDALGQEHRFAEIDQSKLKSISYISNFNWPTDNAEKRVIVTLNFETGMFEFTNGFISQEDKGKLLEPVTGPKKLILLAKKRQSSTIGELAEELREFHPPTDEVFFYNRFLLGFETETKKRVLLIQPTGTIDIWEIK